MKNKKYHTVETVPKSNRTIVERGKIDVLLGTGTAKKSGEVKLIHNCHRQCKKKPKTEI
jgi:hypothetical protein